MRVEPVLLMLLLAPVLLQPVHAAGWSTSRYILSPALPEAQVLVEELGGRVIGELWLVDGLVIEASPGAAGELMHMGYTITEDRVLTLMTPTVGPAGGRWSDIVNSSIMHSQGYTGSGVRIAVLDTGIEDLHPWLVRGNKSVVAAEYDATGTGITDYCGKRIGMHAGGLHGTHVAGIIAGQSGRVPGIAPGSILYDVIVFPEPTCMETYESVIIQGLQWALTGPDGSFNTGDEADIISLSIGAVLHPYTQRMILEGKTSSPLVKALERAVAMGRIVVAAAGNTGGSLSINMLCLAEGVICVGALDDSRTSEPSDDTVAPFSSRGPIPWTTPAPHVIAPGVSVYSSIPTGLAEDLNLTEPGLPLSGTSMAAPHVSGVAAVLIEYLRSINASYTPLEVLARLIEATGHPKTFNPLDSGGGVVDAWTASRAEILMLSHGKPWISAVLPDTSEYAIEFNITGISGGTVDIEGVEAWLEDYYMGAALDGAISVDAPSHIAPGGWSRGVVRVNPGLIEPGVYSGYITLWANGYRYRLPLVLVKPIQFTVASGISSSSTRITISTNPLDYTLSMVNTTILSTPDASMARLESRRGILSELLVISPGGEPLGQTLGPDDGVYVILASTPPLGAIAPGLRFPATLRIEAVSISGVVEDLGRRIEDLGKGLEEVNTSIEMLWRELNKVQTSIEADRLEIKRIHSNITRIHEDLEGARHAIQRLHGDIEDLKQKANSTAYMIGLLEEQINTLRAGLHETNMRVEENSARLDELEDRASKANARITILEEELSRVADRVELEGARRTAQVEELQSQINNLRRGALLLALAVVLEAVVIAGLIRGRGKR
ncbi:MAG: S8 family serine peptidase [Desulfurococcales archaeon]|nr:S8 family serine peptidase [Desulfurococcales archaeon]